MPNVATDASGNIVIAGYFDGTIDTGATGVLDTRGATIGGFVVKLDAACRPAWARSYGSNGASVFEGPVAIDSMGDPVLGGGVIATSIDFGTGLLPTNNTAVHPFLLKLRPDGTTLFVKHYLGDGGNADVFGVAVDAADDILLMGGGFGVSFGGPTLDSNLSAGFIVKLKADATHVWTRNGPKKSAFDTMCATRSGFVYLVGPTTPWLLVGNTLTDSLGNPGNAHFMTAFDANGNQPFTTSIQPTGGMNWGVTCGATPQEAAEVAYGNGNWMDPMAVRGLRMVAPDGTATPVVEWGVQGELSMAGWLDVDGARNTVEVGTVVTPIHVGGITITPPQNANGDSLDDIYVVKRDPAGVVLRAGRVGAASQYAALMDFRYAALGATVDVDGNLVIDYLEKNPDGSYDLTIAKYAL
jgi:hypothetical protein